MAPRKTSTVTDETVTPRQLVEKAIEALTEAAEATGDPALQGDLERTAQRLTRRIAHISADE